MIKDQDKTVDALVEGTSSAASRRQEFASIIGGRELYGRIEILRAKTQMLAAWG